MLQVEALNKTFGERIIFRDISFSIERGQKVGLIATNGSGKTTLMNILTGVEPYDSGSITFERDVRWAYLTQTSQLPSEGTILEACFSLHNPTASIVLRWYDAVERSDSASMEALLPEMEASGGWHYEQRAKEILGALGIHDIHRSIANCSGGELKRIALAATLISEPELLFLDEPTNHLDLATIEWLENYLSRSTMSLLLVTHDRYFLDRVCNGIIELDRYGVYRYKGNYDYYLQRRDERIEAEASMQSRSRNLFRKELEWMRRQPQARAGKAQYRIDAFHALEERLNQARGKEREVKLTADAGYIGKKIFEAHRVSKAYGNKVILRDFDYIFSRYDKIGIVGENGVGKTTFIKMLLGLEPVDNGHFDIGQTVRFGYYSQTMPDFAPNKTVIEVLKDIADVFTGEAGQSISVSQMLTQFLFPPERQYTEVGKLSGGELRRLYLCTVLVRQPNFLILDEPTNDLDIPTLQVLEEYLSSFAGCVLIVSHDRFFMDKIVNHLLTFEGDGVVKDFPGNYSLYRAYLEAKEAEEAAKREQNKKEEATAQEMYRAQRERAKKLSYAEKKELEEITTRIQNLELEQKELEAKLGTGALASDELIKASERIGIIIDELDELTLRQLELEDKQG